MLAVVKVPRTQNTRRVNFSISGEHIPNVVLDFMRKEYGHDAITIDEETVRADDCEEFRKIEANMTSGDAMRAARELCGMTQKQLAAKMGIAVQNVSALERGRRPVTRKVAAKLGEIFQLSPEYFFKFSA